jgi:hypothetical protein
MLSVFHEWKLVIITSRGYADNKTAKKAAKKMQKELIKKTLLTVVHHTYKSETQNVDLTDKVRANHYLRHFELRSALHDMNRTGSFRYMSDETSEGAQLQGYMLE